jgi:hypothetical protein
LEQTYFNGNLNNFAQLRISFEHIDGGAFASKLDINQFQYEQDETTNLTFYAYVVFFLQFLGKIIKMLKYIKNRTLNPKSIVLVVFACLDFCLAYFIINKIIATETAVELFKLKPRES